MYTGGILLLFQNYKHNNKSKDKGSNYHRLWMRENNLRRANFEGKKPYFSETFVQSRAVIFSPSLRSRDLCFPCFPSGRERRRPPAVEISAIQGKKMGILGANLDPTLPFYL